MTPSTSEEEGRGVFRDPAYLGRFQAGPSSTRPPAWVYAHSALASPWHSCSPRLFPYKVLGGQFQLRAHGSKEYPQVWPRCPATPVAGTLVYRHR